MCHTVVLSSLLDPLHVSCHAPEGSRREREREKMPTKVLYLSLTVLVIELRYLYLGTHLIPEVVGTRYT